MAVSPNRELSKELSLELIGDKKMADLMELLEGKKENETIWVENLLSSDSIYHSDKTKDKYNMAPNGVEGSVVAIPVAVAKESYFRRAVSRGKLGALTQQEALTRMDVLVGEEGETPESGRMLESLEKGASDVGARYKKKDLTDDGTEGRSKSAQQIWAQKSDKGPSTVRRSDIKAPAIPLDEVPDGPIPAVVTETVKEGEWQSDTGLD